MRISNIKIVPDGTGLSITLRPVHPTEAELERIQRIDPKDLEVKIQKIPKHRSLDANAYLWVLCDRIASVINTTKEDVYREAVRAVGVFDYIAIVDRAVQAFVKSWTSRGIGWIADVQESKIAGCKKICCYYGSSTYDTKQMSRLIDHVVDEAKGLDIETMTPDEIARLKAEWRD